MKILVLHQPFPMGNYKLMPYIGFKLQEEGHEVTVAEQLNGSRWTEETLKVIQDQKFDATYFEMLDSQTFQLLEKSNIPKKILCYTSKGIFDSFEDIIQFKDRYFTSILTNSKVMQGLFLNNSIQSEFFEYYPAPLFDREITFQSKYNFKYTYLGGGFQRLVKPEYKLESDIIYNNPEVVKFGNGWTNVPNYRGILPQGDIGTLYHSSEISIGTIEPSQRKKGMINNRFSEMMKSGTTIAAINYGNVDYYGGEEFIQFINSSKDLKEVKPLPSSQKSLQQKFIEDKESRFFKSLNLLLTY